MDMSKLQMFIDAVQDVAPQIWEIYVRQVQVEGWTSIVIGVLSFASVSMLSFIGLRRIWSNSETAEGDKGFGSFFVLLFAVTALAFLVYNPDIGIRSGILKVANPQYEAVSMIMKEARKN